MSAEPESDVRPCPQCQSPVFDDELYCEACGCRADHVPGGQPVAAFRSVPDRRQRDLTVIAGITDRGHRRHRNEDAFAIGAANGRFIAVVCDGVASTANPDQAALEAARTAYGALGSLLVAPDWPSPIALEELMGTAFLEAQRAVTLIPDEPDGNDLAPSTTMVVVVARPGRAVVGNVGDSRAYWLALAASECQQLTIDDSSAQESIAEGMTAEVAYAHPDAHTITRWIGADADSVEPGLVTMEITEPGLLVVCSDGLWNYFGAPQRLLELIPDWASSAPLEIARRLTDAALAAGGQDNITVVVAPLLPVESDLDTTEAPTPSPSLQPPGAAPTEE